MFFIYAFSMYTKVQSCHIDLIVKPGETTPKAGLKLRKRT